MQRSQKLLTNSIVLLFGIVLTKGLNFIMAPLFTRWISTNDYGTFDLMATYSTLLIPILALGIHHAVLRFLLEDNSKENITLINTNAVIINLLGITLYIICVIIVSVIFEKLADYIIQLTFLFLAQTFQNYSCMFIRGIKKIKLYTILNIFCTCSILILVSLFIKVLNMGLKGMILGYSISYFMCGLIGFVKIGAFKYLNLNKINKNKIKEMLKYSLPMIPNSIAWWIVNISDRVIVSVVLGPGANAILAVAHKIPNLCITMHEAFQTAWIENASEAIKDKDWNSYFNKTFNVMGQICISISIIIVTTNFFLYDILFTGDYSIGKQLIPLLAFAIIFNALSQTLGTVFIAEYNSKQQGITMLEAGAVNIIVHLLLIKYIGLYASVISTIIAYIYLFLIRYKKIKRKYEIKINKETIFSGFFMIICIIFFYINVDILNYFVLVLSVIFCLIINKNTVQKMTEKILKKEKENKK